MFAFLKRLFSTDGDAGPAADPVTVGDYVVTPTPRREANGWRVAGLIERPGEPPRQHQFVRADVYNGLDDAVNGSLGKARRIIAEQGERMFESG